MGPHTRPSDEQPIIMPRYSNASDQNFTLEVRYDEVNGLTWASIKRNRRCQYRQNTKKEARAPSSSKSSPNDEQIRRVREGADQGADFE